VGNVHHYSLVVSERTCDAQELDYTESFGIDDWNGYWTQNSSLPAFRTIQEIVDPNKNTTSTLVFCNTAAFSSAPPTDYDQYDYCEELYLNDNCDLVCVDEGFTM